jgi:hypothetical protein
MYWILEFPLTHRRITVLSHYIWIYHQLAYDIGWILTYWHIILGSWRSPIWNKDPRRSESLHHWTNDESRDGGDLLVSRSAAPCHAWTPDEYTGVGNGTGLGSCLKTPEKVGTANKSIYSKERNSTSIVSCWKNIFHPVWFNPHPIVGLLLENYTFPVAGTPPAILFDKSTKPRYHSGKASRSQQYDYVILLDIPYDPL